MAPKYRQIAEKIRADILSGQYPPGSRLPSLTVLSDLFDTSGEMMRSALRTLKAEGYVRSQHGVAYWVMDPVPRTATDDASSAAIAAVDEALATLEDASARLRSTRSALLHPPATEPTPRAPSTTCRLSVRPATPAPIGTDRTRPTT